MLQTKSRGLDTNILEIKTWQFTPYGASVVIFWLNINPVIPDFRKPSKTNSILVGDRDRPGEGKADHPGEAVHGES